MNGTTIMILIFIGGVILFVGLFVLFALPLLGTIGGLGLLFNKRVKQANAANAESLTWPSTRGKILKSRVQVAGGEYTTVAPHIQYQYQVGAVEYTSTQIQAGDQYSGSYSSTESYDLVDQFQVDQEVEVFYNPQNPGESALVR